MTERSEASTLWLMVKTPRRPRGAFLSAASVALANLLDVDGSGATEIRNRFHWTNLWRLKTGLDAGEPPAGLEAAVDMEDLSHGVVTVRDWTVPARGVSVARRKAPARPARQAATGTDG